MSALSVREAKEWVEDELARPLTPTQWARLTLDVSFEELLDGMGEAKECVDQLHAGDKEAEVRQPERRTGAVTEAEVAHARALTALVYEWATHDESVLAFRKRHLGDELMTLESIPEWVTSTRARDGGQPTSRRLLAYPDAGELRRESVAEGGVLDELRKVADALAGLYTWQQQQAVAFVLADAVPIVSVLSSTLSYPSELLPYITIRASAEMSPESVYAAFVQERNRLHGTRYRPLGVGVWEAVEFSAFRGWRPWRSLRKEWSSGGT